MSTQTTFNLRDSLRILGLALLVSVVPPVSGARAQGGRQRSFAEKLRYGPGLLNHPVNVVPSANLRIPQGWPTDVDGSITCLTCHRALPSIEGATEYLLRDFDEANQEKSEFCIKCHTDGSRRNVTAMHWMAVGGAHIKPDTFRSRRTSGRIDAESRRCLGCHDGVTASEHQNSPLGRAGSFIGDRRRSHPIGIPYRGRTSRNGSPQVRPEGLLPVEVRLPGGTVSCVSCHDLYRGEPNLLTVPIEGSQLCFTCHEMD